MLASSVISNPSVDYHSIFANQWPRETLFSDFTRKEFLENITAICCSSLYETTARLPTEDEICDMIGRLKERIEQDPEGFDLLLKEYSNRFQVETAEGKKKLEEAEEELAEVQREKAEIQKEKAEIQKEKAEIQKEKAEIQKNIQDKLAKQFYTIFSKDKLAEDDLEALFTDYLSDDSITVVQDNPEEDAYMNINSMTGVVKYLSTHSNVKACDFRVYKAAINDISTLADYLKTPAANGIKGLAFKSKISENAKTILEEARVARANTAFPLKVQYFD